MEAVASDSPPARTQRRRGRISARFVLQRLAGAIVVLLLLSFIVFALQEFAPGNLAQSLLPSGIPVRADTIAAVNHEYGLDKPLLVRYVTWLGNAVQLNFGTSVRTGQSVLTVLGSHTVITLELGIGAFLIAMIGGVSLGVIAAVHRRSPVDRGLVGLVVGLVSTPPFVFALLFGYLFAYKIKILPATGPGGGGLDRVEHLILPMLALGLTVLGLVMKLTRASMLATLEQDYVTFARARGLPRWRVNLRYGLRNALGTVVTAGGMVLGYVFTGAVLVENVFALPGLGSLLVTAAQKHDIPVIQGLAMLFAVAIVLVNFVTDVLYALVDPRVTLD